MAVKLLMSWDIKAGQEQEYFEFVVREFIPGIQKLGIQPTEAWYTLYGSSPQILTGGTTEDLKAMKQVLQTEEWAALKEKLLSFVQNFDLKVVKATGGFQM